MDYITSYLLIKDAINSDALLWLNMLHIPHVIVLDTLIIFNINKRYVKEYIARFQPTKWEYDGEVSSYPEEYGDVFSKVNRNIFYGLVIYHAYYQKHENADPFVLPSVYDELLTKACDNTDYEAWSIRWYLCRDGLFSSIEKNTLVESIRAKYAAILDEAAKNVKIDVQGLTVDVFFDKRTFYVGWFVNSDDELSYVNGGNKLKSLTKDMKRLIVEKGLEYDIHSKYNILKYLKKVEVADFFKLEQNSSEYPVDELNDYAIIPLSAMEGKRGAFHFDAFAEDKELDRLIIVNATPQIDILIDSFAHVSFNQWTDVPKEYEKLFNHFSIQHKYNKSLLFGTEINRGDYYHRSCFNFLQEVDAAKKEYEIQRDYPYRVVYDGCNPKEDAYLILKHIFGNECVDEFDEECFLDFQVGYGNDSRVIESYSVYLLGYGKNAADMNKRFIKWLEEHNLEYDSSSQEAIVGFFDYFLCHIPAMQQHYHIISLNHNAEKGISN